ncbi:diuretic hormone class 2 isoform X1 [Drosophila sulfurigaster albostrigata]|uniref:Diuretic hormone class 2 isoform X1 n=1 Tax=Drosophila albomicans TaxID=7291 RepID=A0A6P8WHV3_DROAB|nr:diuretic hormone class 2 isoform X1 [Drosophila albomicans]XP_060666814.1 diuretic hormone class 2 isoform X1 [Drosophila nasuta]XP_062142425.1 diuretic hormone class 2 isoform X1 [Drosophila sulfurigaster albostrigata]XP_062142426.1 diuretic hormone class 2 isoform X1 [Drosophila sulfurigaster albostrigata]XP_062142428.1 diuretic hormone class 2 isoform X1 [Drosophila sulfurigaster albostrigata]
MMTNKFAFGALALLTICLLAISRTDAAPMPRYQSSNGGYGGYNELEEVPDELLMELMTRFGRTIIRARNDLENSKRTVDFGLARGYSGTQEAKHRMGLAAANFPGGPGRRRRSETDA